MEHGLTVFWIPLFSGMTGKARGCAACCDYLRVVASGAAAAGVRVGAAQIAFLCLLTIARIGFEA